MAKPNMVKQNAPHSQPVGEQSFASYDAAYNFADDKRRENFAVRASKRFNGKVNGVKNYRFMVFWYAK